MKVLDYSTGRLVHSSPGDVHLSSEAWRGCARMGVPMHGWTTQRTANVIITSVSNILNDPEASEGWADRIRITVQ